MKLMSRLILVIFCVFSLSGCLVKMVHGGADLENMDQQSYKKTKPTKKKGSSDTLSIMKQNSIKPHIYTMRGLLGIFSTGMDELAKQTKQRLHFPAVVMSYHEDFKLVNYLINKKNKGILKSPIILVGHSYGADTIISVAKKLDKANIPVEMIISVDNTKYDVIPKNVKKAYQIHSGASSFSKAIFGWGKKLVKQSSSTNYYNIDVTKMARFKGVNHFNIDDNQQVIDYLLEVIYSSKPEVS